LSFSAIFLRACPVHFDEMEVFEKIIAILYSLLILANAVCLRRIIGTWLFPGCLFSLFWFCYTFFPLVVLFEVPVNSIAIAFITVSVILFSATFLLFDWKGAFQDNLSKPLPSTIFNTRFLRFVLLVSILISLIGSILHLLSQGFGVLEFIMNPIGVASKFANLRYNDELSYTVFGPISLLFSNIAVIIGGLIFGSVSAFGHKKILFAFLPSIIILLTQSSKGLFFQSVFLFLGGILIAKVYSNKLKILSFGIISKITLIILGLLILLSISFLSRGLEDVQDITILLSSLRSMFATYFFAHIYGFSDWFSAYIGGKTSMNYDTSHYYFGFYTLTAFFRMFGTDMVTSPGVYDEYYVYKDLLESNIYTIFRGMIMDFGLLGSFVFMLVNGYLMNMVFYIFLRKKRPVFTTIVVIFMLEHFYISFIISLLTWMIIPFTFLICYLILKLNNYSFVFKPAIQK
jgi:oligosaccharide repeat unit polymerase